MGSNLQVTKIIPISDAKAFLGSELNSLKAYYIHRVPLVLLNIGNNT